jgi:hypothetical protein
MRPSGINSMSVTLVSGRTRLPAGCGL